MTEETRRKAIEACTARDGWSWTNIVDALSDLMREIAREELYRQVEAHVNSANHVRQVAPPPAPGATEAMLHAMAVEKGTKGAAPAPATLTLGCGICTRGAYHAACPEHGANRPGQGRSDPVVPASDKCEECGGSGWVPGDCGDRPNVWSDPFSKCPKQSEATDGAKGPPETMPEWPGPPGYYPEYVWLSGQTAYSDAPSSGTIRPKYIRADVAAKELEEANARWSDAFRSLAVAPHPDTPKQGADLLESYMVGVASTFEAQKNRYDDERQDAVNEADEKYEAFRGIIGCREDESPNEAARRVVAERDAALRDAQYHSEAADMANGRADRAEARVKELDDLLDRVAKLEAELPVIIQQRDKLEQELTAANLAIESARKTLWPPVKP